jgi:hypothetical protein
MNEAITALEMERKHFIDRLNVEAVQAKKKENKLQVKFLGIIGIDFG